MSQPTYYEGDILRPPGFKSTGVRPAPKEILGSAERLIQKGGTLKGGQGVIEEGTLVAQETATKLYVKYTDGGTGGAGVPVGFVRQAVNTTNGPMLFNIVLGGSLKESALVGLTATAKTALNGRSDVSRDWFIF
jgi:hypothetical protein